MGCLKVLFEALVILVIGAFLTFVGLHLVLHYIDPVNEKHTEIVYVQTTTETN